ncbi:exonuclease domain-containing protein [Ahrensia sp. R2A130]|uniref:exonuclease domain-containing protein n=1 Tax=Ahrensia sp. R2A130 TaxID=744979 RepID=UPI0001E0BCC9|nr:exonuclease domain-containing protein [Ahrensia sp. R2A130]EFL88337.1 exodeoxyribonuclease 10 [Ahrensia sp. R2A130]
MTYPTTIRVIDTETTGFLPDASMVEIAWTDLLVGDDGFAEIGETISHLLKPKHPIGLEAMAVHHITEAMVADAPMLGQLDPQPSIGSDYLAAHNADFDKGFYPVDREWICTLKCSRRLWEDAPSHKNGVLRYWLNLDADMDYDRTLPAHRAGPDSYVTAYLLERMLREVSLEQLVQWSREPSMLPRVNFGKHRGMKFADVPSDYLEWLVSDKCSMGADVKATARFHLGAK